MTAADWPEFREWGIAAVRLLQDVVYADNLRIWGQVLAHQADLDRYFSRLGVLLVVDEAEGLAYLRQLAEDELPAGYDQLPKLFRKSRMGYESTVLCVLLREQLRQFDEEEVHNQRCVVETAALLDVWKGFFASSDDDVKLRKELLAALNKLEAEGFVRHIGDELDTWEVRRILKARLPIEELENLKARLLDSGDSANGRESEKESHDG